MLHVGRTNSINYCTDGFMRSMPLLRLLLAAKAGGLSHQALPVIGENMGSHNDSDSVVNFKGISMNLRMFQIKSTDVLPFPCQHGTRTVKTTWWIGPNLSPSC